MTKGAGSPANSLVFLRMMPVTTTAAMPMKKAETATQGLLPKMAPAKRPMMGSLAPQGMKPVVMMVIFRSRSCSMVRVARMPGTPQPVATRRGMKVLPDRPKRRKIRSMTKAIRAI